ncbi:transposon polyprotein (fragment), putative, partial [Candida dubliniensis CD36]
YLVYSRNQIRITGTIYLYQYNIKATQCTQLKTHNFEDLTGFLIHSPHAKLKFNINEQEIYHTPHFEGRISILAITLITNENILLINNYLHSGDMDAQMTLLNAFTKYIANLKKNIPITI